MYDFEDVKFEVTDIKLDVEEASLSNSESLRKDMTIEQNACSQKGMECVLSSLSRILEPQDLKESKEYREPRELKEP